MSDKYKMIGELGLAVKISMGTDDEGVHRYYDFVKAKDLEALLEKGVRVYNDGVRKDEYWDNEKYHKNTHTALVIDYKPIQKLEPVSKDEFIKTLEESKKSLEMFSLSTYEIDQLIERIEKAGIK